MPSRRNFIKVGFTAAGAGMMGSATTYGAGCDFPRYVRDKAYRWLDKRLERK